VTSALSERPEALTQRVCRAIESFRGAERPRHQASLVTAERPRESRWPPDRTLDSARIARPMLGLRVDQAYLGDDLSALRAVALPAQRLEVLGHAQPTPGNGHDVVDLKQ
jgi:hypothetical protein